MEPGWLLLLLAAFWVSEVQTAALEEVSTADTETTPVEKMIKESIEDTATETPSAADIFKQLVEGLDLEIRTLNHAMQEHGISATENESSNEKMPTVAALTTDTAKVTEDSIRLGFAKKYEGIEEMKKPRAPDLKEVPIWLIIFIVLFTAAVFLGIMYRYSSKRAKKKQDLEKGNKIEKKESQLQKGDAVFTDTEKNNNNFTSAISP
ncbi:uncharacterized protein LOC134297735 isoform X3 [Anolis carolinensis]|uniref:uncharacterized protein LOC134297735 isoform X3 n=1 Tax=Anolis carolinensis TaxID=28377 RepID=UPI002F2B4C67